MRLYKCLLIISAISALNCVENIKASAEEITDFSPEIVQESIVEYPEADIIPETCDEDIENIESIADTETEITLETTDEILPDELYQDDDTKAENDAIVSETEQETSGWNTDEDGRKYYIGEDGSRYTGYNKIGESEYYFAANGIMKNGWYTIKVKDGENEKEVRMYFSPETGERKLGWIDYNGCKYYVDENGKYSGFNVVKDENGEKEYYFDSFGIMQSGWLEINGSKYYSTAEQGIFKGIQKINGKKYVFSSKGKFKSGWQTVGAFRYFYDYKTMQQLDGWINYNGNIYYSDSNSGKYIGVKTIDGIKYRFADNGVLQTGIQKFSDGSRYYDEKGKIVSGFVTFEGNKYYFDSDYIMVKGFKTLDGDKIYYFDENGVMLTGMQRIDGNNYFFNKNGIMQYGIQIYNGKKYYFDYNGIMQTGWLIWDGEKYYFDESGAMYVGFLDYGGKRYYLDHDGIMQTGWQSIGGKKYYFDENGIMQKNVTIDGFVIGADGVAVELSPVRKKAQEIIDSTGTELRAIHNYVKNHNTYSTAEPSKSLNQINSVGWGYFANYAIDNTSVSSYHFAALQGLLFEQAGYDVRIVYGRSSNSGNYYWNQVMIKGEWRNFDAANGYFDVSDEYLANLNYKWQRYVYPKFD